MPRQEIWKNDVLVRVIDGRTLDQAKSERFALLADKRWREETAGALFNGATIPTDETAQTKITAARVAAEADPNYSVNWKIAPGTFVTFNTAAVVAMSNAARSHVQACYDNERAISIWIVAATTNDAVDAVDISTGWPS